MICCFIVIYVSVKYVIVSYLFMCLSSYLFNYLFLIVLNKVETWRMCVDCYEVIEITVNYQHHTSLDDMLEELHVPFFFKKKLFKKVGTVKFV